LQVPDIEKVTGKNAKRPDQIGGGKPGPGRKPGIPNKANGLLKDAIIQAAEEAGGRDGIVGYLTQQARKHPAAFLSLIGRVLPLQVQDRDTSEQIVVKIVYPGYSDRDEPKLVEHVVDQPANAAATAVRKLAQDTDAEVMLVPIGGG
jgi:hypothetical protein